MKYTPEQLSRILGEHACGNLETGGRTNWGLDDDRAAKASWFDSHYYEDMTPEELLGNLESK